MKKALTIATFLTFIAVPAFAQSFDPDVGTCPFRKSYPDVLMMQSSQDRNGDNDTGPLDCSIQGCIFL